jgi:hypothetical protein
MELEEFKKAYEKLVKKFNLPNFDKLNQAFEVEKVDKVSEILLKVIRKIMVEKIVNSLGFVEMLMNPMNAPRMYHSYIKNMSKEDKEALDYIYEEFSKISIDSLEREIYYDEREEAELIKKVFKIWMEVCEKFKRILNNMKNNSGSDERKERNYFG